MTIRPDGTDENHYFGAREHPPGVVFDHARVGLAQLRGGLTRADSL